MNAAADTLRITFCGDLYLGETYLSEMEGKGHPNPLKLNGYDHSFAHVAEFLRRSDLVIANLECPLTTQPRSPFEGRKGYIHAGAPDATAQALLRHNIAAVTLANNHIMDFGAAGLAETLACLARHGIAGFGAGTTLEAARRPFTTTFSRAGAAFKLAAISTFQYSRHYDRTFGFYAGPDRAGANVLEPAPLQEQVAALKADGWFVVVLPHWGSNYCRRDFQQWVLATHILGTAGADLIIGHGAHMLCEFQRIGPRWAVFGLGNFIFNSDGRYHEFDVAPFSLVAQLTVRSAGGSHASHLDLYPIVSDNMRTGFQPCFVSKREFINVYNSCRAGSYNPAGFDRHVWPIEEEGRFCMRLAMGSQAPARAE